MTGKMRYLSILLINLTISIFPIAPLVAETSIERKPQKLLTVSTASDLEKASGKLVKLVGTYVATAEILSWQKSSSGRTFIVLNAKIVTKDNTEVAIYANSPMLGKYNRSEREVKSYHDREVAIAGKITKERDRFSIIPEQIELNREKVESSP
jgi:hypothetical protein